VLVCDDAAEFRELLCLALDFESGVSVVGEAKNGRGCVAAVEQIRPDVVLLDLSMPQGDGWWTLERIRAEVPECAVIIVSALSEQKVAGRARAAGAHDFIEKGAPLARIADAVREAVRAPAS
jgi:DNA-binding NarL/FixJ family response regulator